MKKRKYAICTILMAAVLGCMPADIRAEESEVINLPTCYEDGTISPITTDGEKYIYLNGTSAIFHEGKMYEDFAPFGELGENDKHIYTYPYVEEWKDDVDNGETWYDGKHEKDLTYVYVETGGATDAEFTGDCYLTIADTTLRGVNVNHLENAAIHIKNSDVLRNYIENATGNVNYTIEDNTGEVYEVYFKESDSNEDGVARVCGDLTLVLKNVNVQEENSACEVLACGVVEGDTKIEIYDSFVEKVEAAHITGTETQNGNVYVKAENAKVGYISGISDGYNGSIANIRGDIDIDVKNSVIELDIMGFSSCLKNIYDSNSMHIITGTGNVSIENSHVRDVYTSSNKKYGETLNENSKLTLKNAEIDYAVAGEVTLQENVIANISTDYLKAADNAVWTGYASIKRGVSGNFIWQPYAPGLAAEFEIEKGASIDKDMQLKIIPVKKINEGYVPLTKDECLECQGTVLFKGRTDAAAFLNQITCEYGDLRAGSWDESEDSFIKVVNYCPNHDWQVAASSGYADIMEYAAVYDKNADCTHTGVQTYYCTLCGRYEQRTLKVLGHSYAETKVAPTKTAQGYTVHTCTRCGDSYKDNYTDKLADIFVKKPKLSSVKSTKKKTITVKWKKVKNVTGYIIQYSTNKKFKKSVGQVGIKKNKTTSIKIKKLKSKKTYYVRIATYKKVKGITYTSAYTKAKKVKVK